MRKILLLACASCCFGIAKASPTNSTARIWDEQILAGIRIDTPNPPVHARNLFSLSVCMYDAWAAYDTNGAVGYLFREKHSSSKVAADRSQAISYAAWRLLRERYAFSKSAAITLSNVNAQMVALGYDTNNSSLDTSTPAGLGNAVYLAVSNYFINDGSLETNAYQDPTYSPYNPPLVTGKCGASPYDINRWQPLAITNQTDQNGFPLGPVQVYVGSQWLGVRPFALTRTDSTQPWINPGPQPHLNGLNDAQFRNEVIDVIRRSGELNPDDGATIDISPGAYGNNTLGMNDGTGRTNNPVTGMPYATNLVRRGDFGRVLAEFWADGPNSETPPGHWNVIANSIADNTNFIKRIGGTGPVVDNLEWDVKIYFAVNAAVHEAACAAWSLKRFYEGGRPIEWIRYMGQNGQSSVSTNPSYSISGLPLVTNVVEQVTASTIASGRHAGFFVGDVVIYGWAGGNQPVNPSNHYGAKWMYPACWMPYQKANFVTPAFPGYISGHSTFSRSAAEVLTAITGSPFFPGGLGTFTAPSNSFLTFEQGPSQTVQLQWATYFDASDQAGQSRLWGGIHVSVDDLTGRIIGSQCGQGVWALAQKYWDGSIINTPVALTIGTVNTGCRLSYNTVRGFYYTLQSAPSAGETFTNDMGGLYQAVDTSMIRTDTVAGPRKFYRVLSPLTP